MLHVITAAVAPGMTASVNTRHMRHHATGPGLMYRRLCVHGGTEHELDFSVSLLLSRILSRLEAFLQLVPLYLSIMFNAGLILLCGLWIIVPTTCVFLQQLRCFLTYCQMQQLNIYKRFQMP